LIRTYRAQLATLHRFRKGEGVRRKKRKKVEAFVPARTARAANTNGSVARTSTKVVAEVVGRRLVPNKLGKRAPKSADRVE
jgi:hypothetical protein